ncbi:hypothetical protein AB6A40_000388 [Gnathostoma spinigerum]|uniref:Lipocalin domain-containing protein n=1 Tax=Gnathostoma spinigerum TaxID=75299 RepID=A0ABD6E203_9BILA
MYAMMTSSLFIAQLLLPMVLSIGENPMDLNTITGIIGGIGNMLQNRIETIDIPSKAIMGRWFQMYKAAVNFDVFRTDMFCPVSYFEPNPIMGEDGFSIQEAYRVVSKNGPIETYKRDLNRVGPGQYWMYTEEYFYPRQFFIVHAGPNYTNETSEAPASYDYIVTTDANRLSLMVYAREPIQFFQKYNKEVVAYLGDVGFGGKVFWNSPRPIYQGPDCEWPSEKEVFARRVLKNYEAARKSRNETMTANRVEEGSLRGVRIGEDAAQDGTPSEKSPLTAILRNPQLALRRLVHGH